MERIVVIIVICGMASSQMVTELKVPEFMDPRHLAEIRCSFRMGLKPLQSVKLYYNADEIFSYHPSQGTIRKFGMAKQGNCTSETCVVAVQPLPQYGQSTYKCEASTEGPMFRIAKKTKDSIVRALPEEDPVIEGAPDVAKSGDRLTFNCTTSPSLPPAEVLWFVDGKLHMGDESGTSSQLDGAVVTSWSILSTEMPSSGAMRVRCEAVVHVEPRHVSSTTVIVHSEADAERLQSNSGSATSTGSSMEVIVLVILLSVEICHWQSTL